MAYSALAEARRRCTGRRKDGEACQAWALWDDPLQRCTTHAGRRRLGPGSRGPYRSGGHYTDSKTRYTPCTCGAYNWPHRPGGGLCRWPEEPLFSRTTPAGQHAAFRLAERRKWYGHGYFW